MIDKTVTPLNENLGAVVLPHKNEKSPPYPEKDSVIIEIWKYSPELLSDTDLADPLSLYLSMKDIEDERIENSLEELLDKVEW